MSFDKYGRNPCRNLNHGRAGVTINYCPDCGMKFEGRSASTCNSKKHGEFRKQRFTFCLDCGLKLGPNT